MNTPEPFYGPRCGNCGAYFTPGEVVCAACGADRYSDAQPVVGPQARPFLQWQRPGRTTAIVLIAVAAGILLAIGICLIVFLILLSHIR